MRAVDLDRVRDLLGHIADARRRLAELGRLTEQNFLADFRNTGTAKYLAVVAAEASIDLCNHLVARLGGRAPRDYADCFSVLAELGIVSSELARRLGGLARFRNLLVHLYAEVDDGRVHTFLRQDLGDLDAFRDAVLGWLRHQDASGASPGGPGGGGP